MKKILLIALLAIGLASCKKEQQVEPQQNYYEYLVYGQVNYVFYEPAEKSRNLLAGTHYFKVQYDKDQKVRAIVQLVNPNKKWLKIEIKKNGITFLRDSALDYLDIKFVAE